MNSGTFATREIPSQLISFNPFRWLPSLIFWLIAVGVPYLMYQSLGGMMDESMKWTTGKDGYYEALVSILGWIANKMLYLIAIMLYMALNNDDS